MLVERRTQRREESQSISVDDLYLTFALKPMISLWKQICLLPLNSVIFLIIQVEVNFH